MSKKEQVVELVAKSANISYDVAESVVDRLRDEGYLVLGFGDSDIDKVVMSFSDAFGTTRTSKADRWAANRLVKKYSSQAVVGVIQLLAQRGTENYAPVVNDVVELEKKWVSVLAFLRKTGRGGETLDV